MQAAPTLKPMTEPTPNDQTLHAYNTEWNQYIINTPGEYLPSHAPLLRWIDFSLNQLPEGASILEIGSGNGREARYMINKGHRVVCSDGAIAWVDFLTNQGLEAQLINVLRDDFEDTLSNYQMVFANALMPHFNPEELTHVLEKIKRGLPPEGLLAFSAKQGNGGLWVNEKLGAKRFVYYWDVNELKDLVESLGFELLFFESDIPGDLPTHTWVNLTAKKI